ncbi:NlpC/P60 family protein [Austwickia chelonae]|uniref:C40 family peptidase n=1 Tax=Austwickia chelonae TaxID=100225 RepID=UPI00058C7E9E|nr:C40 family peptidase [Austwickia chelonae]SEV92769.1 NlpC/P60 family protein [Austwickia chelonae]
MSKYTVGRHRAPGRLNPVSSFSSAVARGARPAVAATATVAAAGSMALAGTANASPTAPNAVAAEAVVLTGGAVDTTVSYGLPVMAAAEEASEASSGFASVALSNRAKPQAEVAETAYDSQGQSKGRAGAVKSYSGAKAKGAMNPAPKGSVLGVAASLSGIPYLWGGTTPSGFDCSGYVQYVFRQAGISLPRTSGAQRAATTPVSNPQPGDLVFFGTWHVGIYAGNGMMYDAPTAGQTTGLHKIWSNNVSYGRVG